MIKLDLFFCGCMVFGFFYMYFNMCVEGYDLFGNLGDVMFM